jgi:hypothetical protein
MSTSGNAIDVHRLLSKLPLRNTALNELHYYHPIDGKYDAYTGPFTNLSVRCEPSCVGDKPKSFNFSDYVYDSVTQVAHEHDHDYEQAERNGTTDEDVKQLKLASDRKMLSALEGISTHSFGEFMKKKLVQGIIGLKVKLGLGISNLSLDEVLGLGVQSGRFTEEQASVISRELHHPIVRRFPYRKIICFGKDELFTSDLCEMKSCNGFKYILVVLDVYTKHLWTIPLRNKEGTTITQAFKELFEQTRRVPSLLWTDQGSEFFNQTFKKFLESKGIRLYHTYSERKACMAERVIRTLRDLMEREISKNELLKREESWPAILKRVTNDYNNSVHNTTRMTPTDASKQENAMLLQANYAHRRKEKRTKPKFKVGDYVRLYAYKGRFTKGAKSNFTREVFKVVEVLPSVPPTYRIADKDGEVIEGSVYAEELVRSNVETF